MKMDSVFNHHIMNYNGNMEPECSSVKIMAYIWAYHNIQSYPDTVPLFIPLPSHYAHENLGTETAM
jgi:hypothetical protein